MKFGWERRRDDLNEELQTHLRMAIEDRIARGESTEAARAQAMRELGNAPLVADVTRGQWGWEWLERMGQDIRYAARQLRKSPGYTATALLTLTLAVGANTAIFGLCYALLLRSLPVERPDQIVQIKLQLSAAGTKGEPSNMVSDAMYDLLSKTQTVFTGMCGWQEGDINLHEADGTRPVPAASLTGECMRVLGLHPAVGRLLEDADDRPGGASEGFPVVLGYDYWRTHFGADPAVLGRAMEFGASMRAGAAKGVVVGVMAPGFESVQVGGRPNLYVPLAMTDPENQHNLSSFDTSLIARLKDGVSTQRAQAQLDAVFQSKLKADTRLKYFTFLGGKFVQADQAHVLAVPGRTGYFFLRQFYQKPLYLIEGMVALSLLVACAYLAMLASARALARRRELALRMALGASRRRLVAQLTWESVLLALAGGALGILAAWGAERGLLAMIRISGSDKLDLQTGPGAAVLLFTLALMGPTVILSGVWPAWRVSKVDPASDIKEGEAAIAGRRSPRMGNWLVPLQIAFSLLIVTMAALMGATVSRLLAVDPGFRTSGVTFLRADFSPRLTKAHGNPQGPADGLYLSLLDRIRHTPGVEGVSISQAYPLEGGTYMEQVSSQPNSGGTRTDNSLTQLTVTPGYFDTMGVPVLRGRNFTLDDRGEKLTVCILNRSAAEYFFPGGDAIGGIVSMDNDTRMRVVGIVGDTLYNDLRQEAPRIIYQPALQGGISIPFTTFEVRARDAGTAVKAVRNAFRELAPDVAVDKPVTMRELVASSMGRERMVALLAGFFALLTLALTGIGLYGVLNYGVVGRRTEIGVRMALGATPGAIVVMILREAMRLVIPGLVIGAAGMWAATRLLSTLLYGVKPLDPWACAVSMAVLIATAVLACALPARRAAALNPTEALRFE